MKNIFSKIGDAITAETLGTVRGKGIKKGTKTTKSPEPPVPTKKKEDYIKVEKKKPKKLKPVKQYTKKVVDTIEEEQLPKMTEYPQHEVKKNLYKATSQYAVLQLLGIPLQIDTNNLMTSEDIENVSFTITAPTGFSPEEVESLCDKVQMDLKRYQEILELKQAHFILLLEQIEMLEEKLIEQQRASELASFILENKTSEEKLKETIAELRIENSELKEKITKLTKRTLLNDVEEKPIQVTNDIKSKSLPTLDDDFDIMLED